MAAAKRPTTRKTGGKLCKVCGHPGRATIDGMLDSGNYSQAEIITWAKDNHPDEAVLNGSNLSRHKNGHPLLKAPGLELPTKVAPAPTALMPATSVRAAVPPPEERVTLAEATAIVLNLALQNALRNPEMVTLKDAAQFAELGRKLGLKGSEEDDFRKAWEELAGAKGAAKAGAKKVKVKVTKEFEASQDDGEPAPVIIDAEPVPPASGWAMPTAEEMH